MRTSKNNVVIFSWNLPRGGLPKVILKEYYYFQERKISPTILTFEYPQGAYEEELSKTKLKILKLNEMGKTKNVDLYYFFPDIDVTVRGTLLNDVVLLNSYLREEDPSVVISHQLLSAILIMPYCLIYRKAYVLILHDNPFLFLEKNGPSKGNIFGGFIRAFVYLTANLVIHKSKRTICTTAQIYDVVKRKLFLKDDMTIAEYGIDTSQESDIGKRKLLLTVSKWSKFRNPKAYVELLNFLPQNINLTMAGRWDSDVELKEFMEFVERQGLSHRIKVIVDVSENELSKLYDETRVFLRLGFGERGTGQAILEALGHGCPVVISKDLGASTIIEDGKQGFLVDENDLPKVANKISMIFNDDNILRSMVSESYDLSKRKGWNSYLETVFKAATDFY